MRQRFGSPFLGQDGEFSCHSLLVSDECGEEIVGQVHVCPGLIVVERWALLHYSMEEFVRVNVKIEDEISFESEPEEILRPLCPYPSDGASGDQCEDVAIC